MNALAAMLITVLLVDQGVKLLVLRQLGGNAISLAQLGRLEVVRTRFWLARLGQRTPQAAWWAAWLLSAAALAVAAKFAPGGGWWAGLLLGGSLSHLLENAARGWICDFICLRFWPAFNLADVAICVGALCLVARVAIMLT